MSDDSPQEIRHHRKMALLYIFGGVSIFFPSLYVAGQHLETIGMFTVGFMIVIVSIRQATKHQLKVEELENAA